MPLDPYYNPWDKVGQSISNGMFNYMKSRPNPADVEKLNAEIRYRNALANKANIESQQIQGQIDAPGNVAAGFRDIFAPYTPSRPSPEFVGPIQAGPLPPTQEMITQRYQEQMPNLFSNAMRYSGDKPGNLGDVFLAIAGSGGAPDDALTGAQMGAGMDYKHTKPGFEADPDNLTTKLAPGNVLLDKDFSEIYTAPFKESGNGFNITLPDGTVINQGPPLQKSVITDLQQKDINLDTYQLMSSEYRKALSNNPASPGTRGNLARIADSVLGQVQQFAPESNFASTLNDVRNNLAGQFTDPNTGQIVNEDLYAASTIANLLPFTAASAIVGQSGRDLSNPDRELVAAAVGSPEDWLGTNEKLISRLDQLDNLVMQLRQKYQGRLMNAGGSFPINTQPTSNMGQPAGWTAEDEMRLQELEQMMGGQ